MLVSEGSPKPSSLFSEAPSSISAWPPAVFCGASSSCLAEYWISQLTTLKKKLYFRVERGPHMWPIISISTCLPFSNSYRLLIGSCLAGGVLNSCHIRMRSLSYSELEFGALIDPRLPLLSPPDSPSSPQVLTPDTPQVLSWRKPMRLSGPHLPKASTQSHSFQKHWKL